MADMPVPRKGSSIGIDLGTTNSLAAMVGNSGTADILPNRAGEAWTPSVISPRRSKQEAGNYLVGTEALHNFGRDPRSTIRSIKRLMGLTFNDPTVRVAREQITYEILEDPSRANALVVRIGGSLLTPEEVSAKILERIKTDAEERLNSPVTHAVITVPAYFKEPQRAATWNAGLLAGLSVTAILDEPTAAALSEYHGVKDSPARVLVFDFGGGTLDFSLLQITNSGFTVISYGGDNFLGGDDIDRGLARVITERIFDEGGVVKEDDYRLQALLKQEAEAAKKILSSGADTAQLNNIPVRRADGSMLDLEMELTPADLARTMAPIERRVREALEKYLRKESLPPESITDVLMVGGSSAVPAIQRLLRDIFESDGVRRVRLARSPMEAVAKGAALYARMIVGVRCICGQENDLDAKICVKCNKTLQSGTFTMDDATSRTITSRLPGSMGVGYRAGNDADAYQVILRKGSLYPITEPIRETFRLPSTLKFTLNILEGDELKASQNHLASVLQVDQLPPDVKEGDPVTVGFAYDRNRILYISITFPSSREKFSPQWKLDRQKETPPDEAINALLVLLPRVRNFLNEYRELIEQGVRIKLQDDLDQAQNAITTSNRTEAERLQGVMSRSLFDGCGIASTLFMAEHTIAGDHPKLGHAVKEGAMKLRQQAKERDPEKETTRKALEQLVTRALMGEKNQASEDLGNWDMLTR
jgi:molecular chaperone DnaK